MGNSLTWCIFWKTIADSPLTSSWARSAILRRYRGCIFPRHMKAHFVDVTLNEKEALSCAPCRRRDACGLRGASEQISTSLVKKLENRPGAQISLGTARSCGSVVFCFVLFLSPSSPLWLTIFYITTTQPGLGTDSPAKVLCDRKTCTKWKTTNLSRVFSSSRRSAATAQILYGEHSLCSSSGLLLNAHLSYQPYISVDKFAHNSRDVIAGFCANSVCFFFVILKHSFLIAGDLENKDFNAKVSTCICINCGCVSA